jgi:hypothetical protein
MRIHLYTHSWNDERMLGFFFRHYEGLVERYVVYDDGSTDGTLDLLRARPNVEVRRFRRAVADSFVLSQQRLQNEVWKESRGSADWVIVSALDEHLHHADLAGYLETCKRRGITAIPALGFQMVAREFPAAGTHLAATLTRGAPEQNMSKLSIFDPGAIAESRFSPGRHWAAPTGRLHYPRADEVLNLHYKYLGMPYLLERRALLRTGLGKADRKHKLGHEYSYDDARMREEFDRYEAAAFDLAADDARARYRQLRWWRPVGLAE